MFDPLLRPLKDRALAPVARRLSGASPTAVTLVALFVGLGAALAAWAGAFITGLALWIANRVLDGLDGAVARTHGRTSDLGGYLDLVTDFVVYAAIPVAFALRPGADPRLPAAALLLLAVFYVNPAAWMVPAALLEKRGRAAEVRNPPTSVIIPEAMISGGETVVFYTLFFLFPRHQVALFLLMAGLTGITVLQRVLWGIRKFGTRPSSTGSSGAMLILLAITSVVCLISPPGAAAQVRTSEARVTGAVLGQGTGPLSGVEVRFDRGGSRTLTDDAGRFRLSIPADAPGTLTFSRSGYVAARQGIASLAPGAHHEVAVTLAPLYALDAVTVVSRRQRPLLNTDGAETGGAVEPYELRILPTNGRNPLTLAFNVPGVAQSTGFFGDAPPLVIDGDNALYTQYTADGLDNNEGFLGGPRVEFPLSALERLNVRAAVYQPSFGRSTNGVVDMETRAGGNAWTGEVFVVDRPGIPLDARPKFAPDGVDPDGFKRAQVGGSLGGPLRKGATFAFGTVEYTNEQEDRIGSTARASFLGTEEREIWKMFGRLDQGWSPSQSTTLRFAMSDVRRRGQGGGVIVPEADITTRRIGSLTNLTHRIAFRGGRASNRLSAQVGTFTWNFPPSASDLETPQVTIVAPDVTTVEAVVGSTNYIFDESELQLQFKDEFETHIGDDHALRLGMDVVTSSFKLRGANTNPRGAYTVVDEGNIEPSGPFVSIRDIPADVRVLRYSIDAHPQQVDLTQTLWAAFVEDRWRVTPALTLQGGVRWDYDDITSRGESKPDLNNFQPRLSFNWLASPRSVVRGGWGLYTGKFPYAVYSDAVQFGPDGNAVVTFEEGTRFPPPAFRRGPTASDVETLQGDLPPREVRRMFARGLDQPYSAQASLGYQRQFGDAWSLSVDGVWVESHNLPRSWDLNAIQRPLQPGDTVNRSPEFGDAFRPVDPATSGYRRLTTTDSGGRGRYLALQTTLRRALVDHVSFEGSWVWSRTRNDTEDINFNAAEANDYAVEWADGVNDRRHHVTVRGLWDAMDALRVSGTLDWQSGTPVNRVAYFRDLDGSGAIFGNGFVGNYDRFPGVPRNGERLPSAWTLAASVAWTPRLAGGKLEMRVEGFNLLNRTNYTGFANGIPGGGPRTQVGWPGAPIVFTTAAPPRQFQLSAQWAF